MKIPVWGISFLIISISFLIADLSCSGSDTSHKQQMDIEEIDVLIYGATPSGIMTAVSAKREGKSVLIVEPSKWVGGILGAGHSGRLPSACTFKLFVLSSLLARSAVLLCCVSFTALLTLLAALFWRVFLLLTLSYDFPFYRSRWLGSKHQFRGLELQHEQFNELVVLTFLKKLRSYFPVAVISALSAPL